MSKIKDYLAEVEDIDDLKVANGLEDAHQDYEHRKQIIVDRLTMLKNDTPYQAYKDTLDEAIDFLREKEI